MAFNLKAYVEDAVTRRLLRMNPAMRDRLLGVGPVEVKGLRLDRDVAALAKLLERSGKKPLDEVARDHGLEAARTQLREGFRAAGRLKLRNPPDVRELRVRGGAGMLPARLYKPKGTTAAGPLMVYFHGGGYVLGDLDSHDTLLRYVCAKANIRVLAVDYRLAPEHPYPAAAEDAVAAYQDIAGRAQGLGADPTKIAIGGDSAGGALALIAAHEAPEELRPKVLWLVNPAVDMVSHYPSHDLYGEGFLLSSRTVAWFRDTYVTDPARRGEPFASPINLPHLSRLPVTWISAGRFDPLSDQVFALADRLRAAGVESKVMLEPTLVHNYPNLLGYVPAAKAATDMACGFLSSALAGRAGGPRDPGLRKEPRLKVRGP